MSNNGNHYFEVLNRLQGELTEESLVQRMSECNLVLGELSKSAIWKIVLDDSREMIKQLDNNWQDMQPDSAQFKEARVLKMACKHISDLPGKYLQELNIIQEKLRDMQSPDKVIEKDSDNN